MKRQLHQRHQCERCNKADQNLQSQPKRVKTSHKKPNKLINIQPRFLSGTKKQLDNLENIGVDADLKEIDQNQRDSILFENNMADCVSQVDVIDQVDPLHLEQFEILKQNVQNISPLANNKKVRIQLQQQHQELQLSEQSQSKIYDENDFSQQSMIQSFIKKSISINSQNQIQQSFCQHHRSSLSKELFDYKNDELSICEELDQDHNCNSEVSQFQIEIESNTQLQQQTCYLDKAQIIDTTLSFFSETDLNFYEKEKESIKVDLMNLLGDEHYLTHNQNSLFNQTKSQIQLLNLR
ncbi:UNKNOWN [Stylonychia lemnae]|uniref:Uncharacterized protein n=1 Tax=Stylonychia lemnae TaxID=5949 RepID=A0A078AX52_STYLE|nr:UNKNOWN [Stylonychia lemnae]|eukprot:CDW86641.1 UNKNOWN [Stylonychia lemnae]